ncbi:MAG: topoisomerase DNA-binding C4 zinc finger domain-containing protein [Lachnospiraceae bacterium]|nr:topoisomerase DNA-binding C4 zinc finger domain-containing protein [Lachnospiraceae bacterium]MBP3296095.1 topoisomerase DNA-binding C4 zinc finger domain-containing protein [Lachnospiraceae bacterium]
MRRKESLALMRMIVNHPPYICPQCGGTLRKIKGPYGEFYGCSNYRSRGCKYKRKA